MSDIKILLIKEKDKFFDKEYLDWHVQTFPRNYPEFLQMEFNEAERLAKVHYQHDLMFLTQYLNDLNLAYKFSKKYLELED